MSRLLCEGGPGGIDAVVIAALLAPDGPLVEPALPRHTSKTNLGPAVMTLRTAARIAGVAAIRDRDFDEDPEPGEEPLTWTWSGENVGWLWRRHELESYLVDPVLVVRATLHEPTDADASRYEHLLLRAARLITAYEAARWTLGAIRKRLPARLANRPERLNKDFELPSDLGTDACSAWVRDEVDAHRIKAPGAAEIEGIYNGYLERFSSDTFGVSDLLLWFSGKDLMTAVAKQARADGLGTWDSAGTLRNAVRDWVRDHPDEALRLMPEWGRLKALVTG